MKDTLILRFLYKTVIGRMLLKILVQPKISKIGGKVLSSRISKIIVPYYIRKHHIDMTDIDVPKGGFTSFNDFFTRKRNMEMLDITRGHLISPCDGFLTIKEITKDTSLWIKHTEYFLKDLLQDEQLAQKLEGGTAFIFRLTPSHYHRYCYAASGTICASKKIQGVLHCVRPVALSTMPVFVQNSREYQVLDTECFGSMVQMEVGALLVGKISNHIRALQDAYVTAGEEKGYFEFGGSTIILFCEKEKIRINPALNASKHEIEIPVKMGEYIASKL